MRTRGLGPQASGLAPVQAPSGTLIAFSTAPGAVAIEGFFERCHENAGEPRFERPAYTGRAGRAERVRRGARRISRGTAPKALPHID